jgi:WD40 repeat protein/predicted Ser/Thr protein kinase
VGADSRGNAVNTLAHPAEPLTPLARWLESSGPLDTEDMIRLMRQLAVQLAAIHEQGRLCLQVTIDAVVIRGDGSARLLDNSTDAVRVVQLSEDLLPPELRDGGPRSLPTALSAATAALPKELGPFDPRRIDTFQLGALVVRIATGGSVEDYFCRPLAAIRLPAAFRSVLDRVLGYSAAQRLSNCQQILDELAGAESDRPLSGRETPSRGVSIRESDTDISGLIHASPRRPLAPRDDLPLSRLGPYEIVARLGSGGMGDVYQGYDASLDRYVAIKVLPAELARHEDFVTRFRTEAAAAAKVEHPNIVPIYTIGADAGHHFFAMQFVAGQSLAQMLAQQPRPPLETTLAIVEQVLAGLAAAHQHGLVHRDIKPGNILLAQRDGRALLADFGLVKTAAQQTRMTATGVIMGTVDYISPEQGRGKQVDGRSDLYSLGVLLYQMLAGRLPFAADSPTAMIFQHAYETPPSLAQAASQAPAHLVGIVHRLLAKSPDDRYQTCEELLLDLQAIRAGCAPPGLTNPHPRAPRSQHTAVIAAPRFEDQPPVPSAEEVVLAEAWWPRLYQRAMLWLGRQAPEMVRHLQNTQQQVDGAVFEYEQRCQLLARLVGDAEEVQRMLGEQLVAHQQAVDRAQHQIDEAADEEAVRRATAERQFNREAAAQLEQQLAQQQGEFETMQLGLAKANARLMGLKVQRDALSARLKSAQARFGLADRRRTWKPGWGLIAAGVVAAVAPLLLLGMWMLRQPQPAPAEADPTETGAAQDSSSSQSVARLPIQLTVDQATQTTTLPVRATAIEPYFSSSHVFFNVAIGGEDGSLMSLETRDGRIFLNGWRRYAAHRQAITDLAYCERTNQLASASTDGEVLIWDWSRRTIFRRLSHREPVDAVAYSPDGSQLLAGTREGVRLWDVMSGSELERYASLPLSNNARSLAWLPDSSGFVAGLGVSGGDASYLVHFDGRSPLTMQGNRSSTEYVTVVPPGDRAAVVSSESVIVWSLEDGRQLYRFGDQVECADFSRSGNVALVGDRTGSFSLWNAQTGSKIEDVGTLETRIDAVAMGGRGEYGVAVAGTTLRAFTLPAEVIPHLRQSHRSPTPIHALSLSPTDLYALSAGPQQVRTWNLQDLSSGNGEMAGAAPSSVVAYSPDGTRMLVARPGPDRLGFGAITLRAVRFPLPADPILRRYRGHAGGTNAANFIRNGTQFVSGGNDNRVTTWEVATEQELDSFDVGTPVKALAVSRDGKLAVLAGDLVEVGVWNLETKEQVGSLKGHSLAVRALALSRSGGRVVTASGDRTARVWDVARLQNLATFDHSTGVTTAAISARGDWIVTGSQDGVLRFWDVESKQLTSSIWAHQAPVTALALAPDDQSVVSAGDDQYLHWWDVPSK